MILNVFWVAIYWLTPIGFKITFAFPLFTFLYEYAIQSIPYSAPNILTFFDEKYNRKSWIILVGRGVLGEEIAATREVGESGGDQGD